MQYAYLLFIIFFSIRISKSLEYHEEGTQDILVY